MTDCRIGVSTSPGQDGGAIDDEVARANQPALQRGQPASIVGRDWECVAAHRDPAASRRPGQGRARPLTSRADPGRTAATACARAPGAAGTPHGRSVARLLDQLARWADTDDAPGA